MGYDLRYTGSTRTLEHCGDYPQALPSARRLAAGSGRMVVITRAWDGTPYSIVRPDGSVSAPAQETNR